MDNHTWESLAMEVAWRLGAYGAVPVLIEGVEKKGLPKLIRIDNGPEFTSKVLDQWAYLNGGELDFIQPVKPMDNALIEAFNGRFRECVNESWFLSMEDAREKVEQWRQRHNQERPHGSLVNLSPIEYTEILVPK